jgi:hypothetical protein
MREGISPPGTIKPAALRAARMLPHRHQSEAPVYSERLPSSLRSKRRSVRPAYQREAPGFLGRGLLALGTSLRIRASVD